MKIITDLLLPDLQMSFPITACPKIAENADTTAKKSTTRKRKKNLFKETFIYVAPSKKKRRNKERKKEEIFVVTIRNWKSFKKVVLYNGNG